MWRHAFHAQKEQILYKNTEGSVVHPDLLVGAGQVYSFLL